MEFIIDRTYIDIQTAHEYIKRGYQNLTDSEKLIYNAGLKGCMNDTDVNRIERRCRALADIYSISGVVTKTNWNKNDIVTQNDVRRWKANVECLSYEVVPNRADGGYNRFISIRNNYETTNVANKFNYQIANAMEWLLQAMYEIIERYRICGESYTGETIYD